MIPCTHDMLHFGIIGSLGFERVYLPLYKVAFTPFHIQGRRYALADSVCQVVMVKQHFKVSYRGMYHCQN